MKREQQRLRFGNGLGPNRIQDRNLIASVDYRYLNDLRIRRGRIVGLEYDIVQSFLSVGGIKFERSLAIARIGEAGISREKISNQRQRITIEI